MYERFTDRALHAMAHATQEVQRFNHEYVGTEHILLGIVKVGSGVAAEVLKDLGVNLRDARQEVEKTVGTGPDLVKIAPLPHTPNSKRTIEFAIEEARNRQHQYIGTEHLFLGLLRTQDSTLFEILQNLQVDPETARNEVIRLLQSGRDHENGLPKAYPIQRIEKEMTWAIAEAKRLKHSQLGTEHLLLGIARKRWTYFRSVLDRFGIGLNHLREAVGKVHPIGDKEISDHDLPHTPNTQKVLAQSHVESFRLEHNYVGAIHLLLAMLSLDDCSAVRVLKSLSVDPDALRLEISELITKGISQILTDASSHRETRPYEGFNDPALQVMRLAKDTAKGSGRTYADVAHVLLGLLKERSGAATNVLKNLHINLRELRKEAEKLANPIATMNAWNHRFYRITSFLKLVSAMKINSKRMHLPLTRRASRMIQHALDESRGLNHNYIGTEHLLLGILREETTPSAQLLQDHGVTLEKTRRVIRELLGQ